jgi:hypothetical protein
MEHGRRRNRCWWGVVSMSGLSGQVGPMSAALLGLGGSGGSGVAQETHTADKPRRIGGNACAVTLPPPARYRVPPDSVKVGSQSVGDSIATHPFCSRLFFHAVSAMVISTVQPWPSAVNTALVVLILNWSNVVRAPWLALVSPFTSLSANTPPDDPFRHDSVSSPPALSADCGTKPLLLRVRIATGQT